MTRCSITTAVDPKRTSPQVPLLASPAEPKLKFSSTPKAVNKSQYHEFLPNMPAMKFLQADSINPRALAQVETYPTANPVGQNNNRILQADLVNDVDASNPVAREENTHCAAPKEQVLNAAGILFDAAKEQDPITPTIDTEPASGSMDDKPDADSRTAYAQNCPVTDCWYHDNTFSSKAQRDMHVTLHYEGEHKCNECNIKNGMEGRFVSAGYFKLHVRKHHMTFGFWCQICLQLFSGSGFVEHLNDCIVHAVELEASGRARGCSLFACDHYLVDFPSKQDREQHMMGHLWPSLSDPNAFLREHID